MQFKYRLGYYLVGFSMGLFLVALVWSGKDTRCNYFPNARVLNNISTKPFYYSAEASKVLAESWIDTIDIKNAMRHGDVDFSSSNKMLAGGKLYVVESTTENKVDFVLEIVNYEQKAVLEKIKKK